MTTDKLDNRIWSLIFGFSLAILLIFLNMNMERYFGFTPNPERSEMLSMLILFGLMFGYFLSLAVYERTDASFFASMFGATILGFYSIGYVISSPPSGDPTDLVLLGLATFTAFTGGMWLKERERFKRILDLIFKKIVWYIFGLHLIYAYEMPLLHTVTNNASSLNLDIILPFSMMTILIVIYFIAVHIYIQTKT